MPILSKLLPTMPNGMTAKNTKWAFELGELDKHDRIALLLEGHWEEAMIDRQKAQVCFIGSKGYCKTPDGQVKRMDIRVPGGFVRWHNQEPQYTLDGGWKLDSDTAQMITDMGVTEVFYDEVEGVLQTRTHGPEVFFETMDLDK